jgi:hypothetical protein
VARVFLLRLPDTPADQDPLIQAAVEARIQRLFDAVASRIAAGGSAVVADEPRSEAAADRRAEPRSFQAAE